MEKGKRVFFRIAGRTAEFTHALQEHCFGLKITSNLRKVKHVASELVILSFRGQEIFCGARYVSSCSTLTVTGYQHHKACTVHCHSSTNVSQSQHAASRKNASQQLRGQTHLNTPAWMNAQTTPKWEHRVFTLCAYAWRLRVFTCMWCMHAGYVCVVVCVAFCLYYIMHLSLSFCVCVRACVCVCVSGIVRPTLQMIELLSKSASACYLLMFMICCANSVNASTWWLLLSDFWTYLIRRHLSTKNWLF